ncbi:MAG: winged helix-turn-helix domain-containing protein [Planctomycetes bacterium]|nr:winged helix-turn-helix domain-containing protein [Planctomycetota bacterium]MCK6478263.1 winged helix-turn-helix domain-containing protein [Phycisphaerales bacterium]
MSTKTTKKPARMSKSAARAEGAARSERLRKAALAEIKNRLDAKPAEPAKAKAGKAPKTPKAPKPAKEKKPKRVSALDAAAQVIAGARVPMRAKEMIAEMEAKSLWKSPGGKTPEATLYAAIIREIAAKGDKARFKKHDKGVFVAPPRGKGA